MKHKKPASINPGWQEDSDFFPEMKFIQPHGIPSQEYLAVITRPGLGTVHEHYSNDENFFERIELPEGHKLIFMVGEKIRYKNGPSSIEISNHVPHAIYRHDDAYSILKIEFSNDHFTYRKDALHERFMEFVKSKGFG